MNANINWIVEQLDVNPQLDGQTDVVVTAHWRCNGEQDGFTGSVYGTCSFSAPGEQFTPYADLTHDQVLGWCWASGVDKDATEAAVQTQIDNQINPPIITPPLPWSQA